MPKEKQPPPPPPPAALGCWPGSRPRRGATGGVSARLHWSRPPAGRPALSWVRVRASPAASEAGQPLPAPTGFHAAASSGQPSFRLRRDHRGRWAGLGRPLPSWSPAPRSSACPRPEETAPLPGQQLSERRRRRRTPGPAMRRRKRRRRAGS